MSAMDALLTRDGADSPSRVNSRKLRPVMGIDAQAIRVTTDYGTCFESNT